DRKHTSTYDEVEHDHQLLHACMAATMTVTLMVLTLNEIKGVHEYLPRLHKDRHKFHQVLIVDGGSTDGTLEYARELGCEVVVQSRPGGRCAYREAYPLIRGDIVIVFAGARSARTYPAAPRRVS